MSNQFRFHAQVKKLPSRTQTLRACVMITAFLLLGFEVRAQIIGGTSIDISEVPWQVSLRYAAGTTNGHICGASIISDRWVLTAAHCVAGTNASQITIHAGSTNQVSNTGQLVAGDVVYLHPAWDANTNDNDIALIHLATSLQFNSKVAPVAAANPCNSPNVINGTQYRISGWGYTSATGPGSQTISPTLNGAYMSAISNATAYTLNTQYNGAFTRAITNNMISMYSFGIGASNGDSGGPAVVFDNNTGQPFLMGACSWSYTPKDQLPSMYSKVSNYETWIKSITGFSASEPGWDLYMKDNNTDLGYAGTNEAGGDKSPDVWTRNQPDGYEFNENPEWQAGSPVNVYVKIRNKGCVASPAGVSLSVYWSKASGWSSWPANWDGTQPTVGNKIATITLPSIPPNDFLKVGPISWTMLNPHTNNTWNSCLLARIETDENTPGDPITIFPNRLDKDVNLNNNIALRNETVVDLVPGKPHHVFEGVEMPYGGSVLVGNVLSESHGFSFHFYVPELDNGAHDISKEAEIRLIFDNEGWQIFSNSGQLSQEGVRIIRDKEIIITSPSVSFNNVVFPANTRVPVWVGFNFLTDSMTTHQEFTYKMNQALADSPATVLGSETYTIKKYSRNPFNANAGGDKEIDKNQSVTVSATQLSETATYNWYDMQGNLVYVGKNMTVSPELTKKYKLEVIASADGFKDYDEVEVKVKRFKIASISPNPATTQAVIAYDASEATSAYLLISQPYANSVYNYVLDTNASSINVNTSTFMPGTYNVILICNGQVAEVKTLTIQ